MKGLYALYSYIFCVQRAKMKRIIQRLQGWFINNVFIILFPSKYMDAYLSYLKKLGINISGRPDNIDRSAYFDSTDYSMIHISDKVVISREVMLLTHDHSIANALKAIQKPFWGGSSVNKAGGAAIYVKPISIGENSFIGARASLLPGTSIGKNCIIGAGAVVKGSIPDNSIVIGNPARVIANTIEWANNKYEKSDYSFR